MIIVDTNIILRYLLNDNEELSKKAIEIIDNDNILIQTEVIIEVSYVLNKVYNIEKDKIFEAIQLLLDSENITFQNSSVIEFAFKTYTQKNLDVVDCMLYAYNKINNYEVKTFDKKLKKLITEK